MPILAGPVTSPSNIVAALIRSNREEPFGLQTQATPGVPDTISCAIFQLLGLMSKLTNMLEHLAGMHPEPPPDDFMQGWGQDDLEDGS